MIIRKWYTIIFHILIELTGFESKPLKHSIIEHLNTIDYDRQGDFKTLHSERKESSLLTPSLSPIIIKAKNAQGRADDEIQSIATTEINDPTTISQTSANNSTISLNNFNNNNDNNNNNNNLLTSILRPLLQKFQFSSQAFFQDRVNQLRQFLTNLGVLLPADQNSAKQFANLNRLFNFIGLDDSGFYTDRLEQGGLLDGNGWFSNKGGLLGGPGAIISTGPLLTDYPTPYRKK